MIDVNTILFLVAAVGFLLIVGALMGAGTDGLLIGMFAPSYKDEWPRGVQETDVPRFAVEHLDALRPARGA